MVEVPLMRKMRLNIERLLLKDVFLGRLLLGDECRLLQSRAALCSELTFVLADELEEKAFELGLHVGLHPLELRLELTDFFTHLLNPLSFIFWSTYIRSRLGYHLGSLTNLVKRRSLRARQTERLVYRS